jgi:SRSO17 transposase
MKKILFLVTLMIFQSHLNAGLFDFKLPPALENIMDFGEDEKEPEPEYKPIKEVEVDYDNDEPQTIIVEKNTYEQNSTTNEGFFPELEVSTDTVALTPVDMDSFRSSQMKIALMVPKKRIGKYAKNVSNSILAYLLSSCDRFQFEVFDAKDETPDSLYYSLQEIKSKGYTFVIAPLTQEGSEIVAQSERELLIYIPTINRRNIYNSGENIIFGGIDYHAQIDKLLSMAKEKIAIFGDGSRLSRQLGEYIEVSSFSDIFLHKHFKNITTNFSSVLKNNHKLDNSTIFLNLPLIKASLLASQINVYNLEPNNILSTQINYNPKIFKLTQSKDREKLYIANSISSADLNIRDANYILGNNIFFNWIEYSTSIGVDYIYNTYVDDKGRSFYELISENQVLYDINIVKAATASFERVSGI